MGRWRMEISPGAARTEAVFLHLIQVGGQDLAEMSQADVTTSDGAATVTFPTGDRTVTLTLSTTGDVGGHIRITRGDETLLDRPLTDGVTPQQGLATVE